MMRPSSTQPKSRNVAWNEGAFALLHSKLAREAVTQW